MKRIIPIIITAIVICLSSCSVSLPFHVTDNAAEKTGEASVKVILGFIRPMDADLSIQKAAKNGGITEISTVDQKVTGGLFVTTYTTVVTGK